MEFPEFIDRIDYLDRLQNALKEINRNLLLFMGGDV